MTSSRPTPPAKTARSLNDAMLAGISLSPQAAQRLGIRLEEVREQMISRHRVLGGELAPPAGGTVVVTSPLAGTIQAPEGAATPAAGSHVSAGTPLFRLQPWLDPASNTLAPGDRISLLQAQASLAQARAEATGAMQAARAQLEAAQSRLERAERLRRENVTSEQAYEEARAAVRVAEAEVTAARERLAVIEAVKYTGQENEALVMTAPQSGILDVEVTAGQVVAAGAPLFKLTRTDPLWVRVPVYVGERADVDLNANVLVGNLGDASADGVSAKPISGMPSASASAATVDLFYELPNPQGAWREGQKVAVAVALQGSHAVIAIPASAVVYDVHGGAWVYEQAGENAFNRRRVEIEFVEQGLAVLTRGPERGARVVTAGASELWGAEFGMGMSAGSSHDEDAD